MATKPKGSKIFVPNRGLGYVSNQIPLQVRYIKSRKENLIVTCVGKSFHTYGISHFGLLSVSGLHPSDINTMTADAFHVYTACNNEIYAWRRGTELKHVYTGHSNKVHLLLPFGVHLISIDTESALRVWDIKDESVHLDLQFDNKTFQISAILHPSTYINKILLGSEQGHLQLWNINTCKLIYSFDGWDSPICCLEQAPALDTVAIGLSNGKIILHNLKFDETIMEFQQDWGAVTSISFRSDGHPIMATGSLPGHIVFWDLEEKRIASQILHAHKDAVTGMVCLPSEPLIITSSVDNTLKLWIFDMTDGGARLLRLREGHSSSPTSIRFHGANGHNILSAGGDSSLRIFNTQTEQFNKNLGRASYNRKSSKKRGRIESAGDPLIMPPIIGFTSETTREKEWDNVACLHRGLPVVTTWSYDRLKMGELKLLPERLFKKNRNLDEGVVATALCLTHCGNFVIVGYSSGHVDKFNIQSGIWRGAYGNPTAHTSSIRGVAVDGLNQLTISGDANGEVKFWKFSCSNKGAENLSSLILDEPVHSFRSHRESSMIAVALEDFSIQIIDLDSRNIVRKFAGHTAQITDMSFSPDSRWLATSGMDCVIRTWDIPSGQLVDQFRTEMACIALDISPTGEALITAHVDYLGIFLWTNKTLYQRITLKGQDLDTEPEVVQLPEVSQGECEPEASIVDEDVEEFKSPEQISRELVTLSGLATSRWQHLLNIDVIRQKNKPKGPPKAPKAAPFFLPTIPSLADLQFAINNNETGSKLLTSSSLTNLTEFGKLLSVAETAQDYEIIVEKLKNFGPSLIEHEIKSLAPEDGGSVTAMLQFCKVIESVLKSNKNFELAQAYLAVFLKLHGKTIAQEEVLRDYLPNVQSCANVAWTRLQEKLMFNLCVVQHVKNLI